MMQMLAEHGPFLALVALGAAIVAMIAGMWAITRCGNLIREQSAVLQRLRSDMLDVQTDSANLTKTARAMSESLGRVTIELQAMRNQVAELAEGVANTKAVVHMLGQEVNSALQSKEVSDLLKNHTKLSSSE